MPTKEKHITCICTANVCRSPMAQKLLQHALAVEEAPLSLLTVISSGLYALEGSRASANSVRVLRNVGLDLTSHRSQILTSKVVDQSLVIFCMTQSHRHTLKSFFPNLKAPVYLLREFMPPPAEVSIPDPYGANLPAYEACRDSIVEAIPSVMQFLKDYLKSNPL